MTMVGMVVGDDHSIDACDVCFEKLLADVGTAVHQEALSVALDQD